MPFSLARDLSAGTPTAGGNTINNGYHGSLESVLRPNSAAIAAGARLVPGVRDGDVILPRLTKGAQVGWADEGGSGTQGDPEFGPGITIRPRTLCGRTRYTRRLHALTSLKEGFEAAVFDDLFRSIWSEVDRVILSGSGISNEPLGILNNTNLHMEFAGENGGSPTWSLLTEMERELGVRLGFNSPTWITNSNVRRKLRNTPKASGLDFCWSDNNNLLGHRTEVTEHIPSDIEKGTGADLSAIIFGDFSTIVLPIWGPAAIDVVVNPYTYAKDGLVELIGLCDIGVGFRHDDAFIVCKDLDTTVAG
ncbi:MAG: phage major capsid protein [Dokdonella sp.]|nr:phage major capsid protein [Dokdonella sp.]